MLLVEGVVVVGEITGENEDEYASRRWPQRAVAGANPAPPPSPKMTSEPRAEIERRSIPGSQRESRRRRAGLR